MKNIEQLEKENTALRGSLWAVLQFLVTIGEATGLDPDATKMEIKLTKDDTTLAKKTLAEVIEGAKLLCE